MCGLKALLRKRGAKAGRLNQKAMDINIMYYIYKLKIYSSQSFNECRIDLPPVQMRKDNSDYEHNGRFNQNMLNI